MTNNIYRILLTAALLVIPIMMPAADLPSLPVASQIKTGMLDNGVAYYLVTNHTEKGKADIALVQKSGFGDETPLTAGSTAVHAMGIDDAASFPFGHAVQLSFQKLHLAWTFRIRGKLS